ncbi:MAG: HypC/HybG/HupF family hydrogenase formation chaperone [Coriobacteriales bacterium]|jgi:hydrogenase expression/formation protein HypC
MCLAIPGKITQIDESRMAQVDIMGIQRSVSLSLLPKAKLGDYVLVHAGFGIEIVDEESARETLDLVMELAQIDDQMDGASGSGQTNMDMFGADTTTTI